MILLMGGIKKRGKELENKNPKTPKNVHPLALKARGDAGLCMTKGQ